jgi:hypothetical protein
MRPARARVEAQRLASRRIAHPRWSRNPHGSGEWQQENRDFARYSRSSLPIVMDRTAIQAAEGSEAPAPTPPAWSGRVGSRFTQKLVPSEFRDTSQHVQVLGEGARACAASAILPALSAGLFPRLNLCRRQCHGNRYAMMRRKAQPPPGVNRRASQSKATSILLRVEVGVRRLSKEHYRCSQMMPQ